jgi:hypothetical protein
MARNVKQNEADDNETDSEQEIWSAIRYLDPDWESKSTDVAFRIIWILLFLLLCAFPFWFHR